eukprot:5026650-Pyramimonas_sp.AAC.1
MNARESGLGNNSQFWSLDIIWPCARVRGTLQFVSPLLNTQRRTLRRNTYHRAGGGREGARGKE